MAVREPVEERHRMRARRGVMRKTERVHWVKSYIEQLIALELR